MIDFVRGVAFILMLTHHVYYFNPNIYYLPKTIERAGLISRTTFLILVGVSMSMFKSKKKKKSYKRARLMLLFSLIITIICKFCLPENKVIFFGVLHFITFAYFTMQNLSVLQSIILGIITILIKKYVYIPTSDNIFNIILGSYTISKSPLDIFPILKWLPYVSLGTIIGGILKIFNFDIEPNLLTKPISLIGKNSLYLYLLHIIPCIIWSSKKYN